MNTNYPKVFVFCIGGTGARVLKSLTFLLAAGVDLKAGMVVPIIIDPDSSNGDLQRTLEILKNYQEIRQHLEFTKNQFFKTDIQTLASLQPEKQNGNGQKLADTFMFDIDGTRAGVFRNFIGYDQASVLNKSLIRLLYSSDNLDADLNVGFKGNPHMGSVVLNQFTDSDYFRYFSSCLGEQDRIFIVSSIFGGTGAAGFPLLVKNIRNAVSSDRLSNPDRLTKAPIGAVTVTPYFGVEPDDSIKIDKNTFISKTKAALEYYNRHLTGEDSGKLNALYYIGDDLTRDYHPAEGKASQKNDAHLVELLCALSIIHFMNLPAASLQTAKDGVAIKPGYYEYGIEGNSKTLNLKNIGPMSRKTIGSSLAQYTYAHNYWNNHLMHALSKPETWAKSKKTDFTRDFLSSAFYSHHLQQFNRRFKEWLDEMAKNERGFAPFLPDTQNLPNLVNDYEQTKSNFWGKAKPDEWDYSWFDHVLNQVENKLPEMEPEKKFLSLFYQATHQIIEEKLPELHR